MSIPKKVPRDAPRTVVPPYSWVDNSLVLIMNFVVADSI
jgi:lysozyme family protein